VISGKNTTCPRSRQHSLFLHTNTVFPHDAKPISTTQKTWIAELRAGSDRLESSLTMTGLDADDTPFHSESFQGLQKISAGLPNISENDPFPSDWFQKFHWATSILSKL
jgi:hypothetical protein